MNLNQRLLWKILPLTVVTVALWGCGAKVGHPSGRVSERIYLCGRIRTSINLERSLMPIDTLHCWHGLVKDRDSSGLDALLCDEDMICWNGEGKVVEFKVIIRPSRAIQLIHQKMAAMLEEKV